jgi:hypothetical protein
MRAAAGDAVETCCTAAVSRAAAARRSASPSTSSGSPRDRPDRLELRRQRLRLGQRLGRAAGVRQVAQELGTEMEPHLDDAAPAAELDSRTSDRERRLGAIVVAEGVGQVGAATGRV